MSPIASAQPQPVARTVLPDPLYYLANFRRVIQRVYERYDDLLSTEERDFYRRLQLLNGDAQALYVRLLTRKGPLFRTSKLRYQEIADQPQAIAGLVAQQLVTQPSEINLLDAFPLFTKQEWLGLLPDAAAQRLAKPALVPLLQNLTEPVQAIIEQQDESLIQLESSEHFATFCLLYFSNGRQDLTEFVLRDLGVYRFENYSLARATRVFTHREQIDKMLCYYRLRDALDDLASLSREEILALSLQLPTMTSPHHQDKCRGDTLVHRRTERLRLRLARQLERLEAWQDALALYRQCQQQPSRERQVRILYRLAQHQAALQLCQQMFDSLSEAEQTFARQFQPKLLKALGQTVTKPAPPVLNEVQLFLTAGDSPNVELAVAQSLSVNGDCFYVENTLFLCIFCLAFWDAIFADVPGAFSNEFQTGPHDLYEEDFANRRSQHFKHGWQKLASWRRAPDELLQFADQKRGIATPFHMGFMPAPELLKLAITRISLHHWQIIFERLLRDLKENRNGLPDLIYFPDEGGYELVEVKGPGDRLQKNQLRWLRYFAEHHIPCQVAYVQWQ
ncbi:VRR-NUC domain-containing protein [Teredinibacter turnerae]|uniref:VRR-NUC domain-containing protein n=1 Tax=Teredinibacter turnerae TaxID=2426 RepID=UPI0003F5634E|nr:VRR-NUC domain-containing protein [Teredinibacter turnerae]